MMIHDLIIKLKLKKYKNEIIGYAYEFFKPMETLSVDYILKSYAVVLIDGEIEYIYTGYAKTPYRCYANILKVELENNGHKIMSYWENYNNNKKEIKKLLKNRG